MSKLSLSILGALAFVAMAGQAMACEYSNSAMSTPTATTADSGSTAPAAPTPTPQSPNSGG